ncbi:hypothetical protein MMC28_000059 [Mycoblastus sanguinarius]|nr:hypothetical protein [Mycoblastus sanguinarius]
MSSNNQKMTQSDAARIQSTQATSGKNTGTGSFAARAQSAGDKNTNSSSSKGSATGNGQGGGYGGGKAGGSGGK